MKRRKFLKSLIALSASIPLLAKIDAENIPIDEFTNGQIEAIKKIKDITISYVEHVYMTYPYCSYRVVYKDGYLDYFKSANDLEEEFGPILSYWKDDLPRIDDNGFINPVWT